MIELKVVRLAVETSSECSKDHVDLYDGWTTDDGTHMARLCGNELPTQTYVTASNLAVVSFTSDQTAADAGFRVDYRPQVHGADLAASSTDSSMYRRLLVDSSSSRGVRSIAMSMSVCLSLRSYNSKTIRPNCSQFLCMLPAAVPRSSSDGVAIFYVLQVLWMTSCFDTIRPVSQNQARRYVSKKFAR